MSAAEIQYKRMPGDILSVDLTGKWQLGQKVPSVDKLTDEFKRQPPVKQVEFHAQELTFRRIFFRFCRILPLRSTHWRKEKIFTITKNYEEVVDGGINFKTVMALMNR